MPNYKIKKLRAGVFIDGANLFWGMKNHADWKIDFLKLRQYLKTKYSVRFYNYYACEDDDPSTEEFKEKSEKQKKFHRVLRGIGYNMKIKSLKHIGTSSGEITKGDMDVDITVDVGSLLDDADLIILFCGDSDFLPLVEKCYEKGKYIRIYSYKELLSWELKTFAMTKPRCGYKLLDELKEMLEYEEK